MPHTVSRVLGTLRAAPLVVQITAVTAVCLAMWAAVNWIYHTIHKPTELLFPVSGALGKTPAETWHEYGTHFRKHATAVIAPELLAALAQVESAGNPLVRTYWQWRPSWHPLEMYRPASSAVGMYQITDGTFAQTKRECLYAPSAKDGNLLRGPGPCWFESLYVRIVPSHAVELAATILDRTVASTLRRQRISNATLQNKQDLATVIHLCGAGAGEIYARRRSHLAAGQRCGDHDTRAYLARVNDMKRVFVRLSQTS